MRFSDRLRSFTSNAIQRGEGDAREADGGRVAAIIATPNIARDGARIEPGGWNVENFGRNPVVLFNHEDLGGSAFGSHTAGSVPVIARSTLPTVGDDQMLRAEAFDFRATPLAQDVLSAARSGHITSTSVRWLPLEHHIEEVRVDDGEDAGEMPIVVFDRSELLEWSFVVIPADVGAMIMRFDGSPLNLADFRPESPPPPPTELDPLSLPQILDTAHALIEGRSGGFTATEAQAAARVYDALLVTIPRQPVAPSQGDELSAALNSLVVTMHSVAEQVVAIAARPPIDTESIVAEAVAKATGRMPVSMNGG